MIWYRSFQYLYIYLAMKWKWKFNSIVGVVRIAPVTYQRNKKRNHLYYLLKKEIMLCQYLKLNNTCGINLFMINIFILSLLKNQFYLSSHLPIRHRLKNTSTSKYYNQQETCHILNCRHMPILMKHKSHNKDFKNRPHSKFILFDNSLRNAYS